MLLERQLGLGLDAQRHERSVVRGVVLVDGRVDDAHLVEALGDTLEICLVSCREGNCVRSLLQVSWARLAGCVDGSRSQDPERKVTPEDAVVREWVNEKSATWRRG